MYFNFFYIKHIDSMLPCVCSVCVPLFYSYHILTSSVIYYWTDARQHGIYLLNRHTATWNLFFNTYHQNVSWWQVGWEEHQSHHIESELLHTDPASQIQMTTLPKFARAHWKKKKHTHTLFNIVVLNNLSHVLNNNIMNWYLKVFK